jgi:hypothetical protein
MYLALLTQRVPVIPPFVPMHIGMDNPPLNFGEIFDLPRFRAATNSPAVEWRDLKRFPMVNIDQGIVDYEDVEPLGCWSVWMRTGPDGKERWNAVSYVMKLGTSTLQTYSLPECISILRGLV